MIHIINQKLDESAASVGLAKYNKSKFPGSVEWVQAGIGQDGRWVTGLDENSIEINSIRNKEDKEKEKARVKQIREELEDLTGFDLTAKSNYWDTFYFDINGQLNTANAIDRIKYHVILSNKFAAPTPFDIDNPDYFNAKFYLSNPEMEVEEKISKKRTKDETIANLFALYDNKIRLKLVGKYLLSHEISDGSSADTIYNKLSDFIEEDKKGENLRKFASAITKTNEELSVAGLVEDACKDYFGIIRYREGLYQRGNVTYGRNKEDILNFFSNLENANEYISVKEELEEKRKYGL